MVEYQHSGKYRKALEQLKVPIVTVNAFLPEPTAWASIPLDFDLDTLQGTGHYPMLEDPEQLNQKLEIAIQKLLHKATKDF